MSTTKRKREEDDNEQLPNKKLKRDIGALFTAESLHQELWIQILSNITLKKIQPIRQVCSQWNKLTRTMDYAKQMCINKFGIDIAPLRVSNLSSLSEVSDSELVFIPTIQQGGALLVDWFEYYELRTILRSFISELIGIMEDIGEEDMHKVFSPNSDVTCDVIKSLLEVDYFNDCDAPPNLRSLLLKLVPLFVHYKRFELAEDAIFLLTNHDSLPDYVGIEDIANYLDLHSLSTVHFPELSKAIFDYIIPVLGKYADIEIKKEKVNKERVEQICRRLIRLVIQLGSEQDNHQGTIEAIVERVNEDGIEVILDTLNQPNNRTKLLLDVIVPTCQEEFDKANDWRIKESSLLALNIADNSMVEYNLACLEFALHALDSEKLHKNVHLVAIITLCIYSTEEGVIKLSEKQFDRTLKHLIDALIYIEPRFVMILLETFELFFEMVHSNQLEIADSDLDHFHNNFFKAILTPGFVRDSLVDVAHAFEALLECTKILGERVIKSLPQYREALFKLASDENLRGTDITPTKLLSLYFEIGATVNPSGYLEEFIEVLKQAEAGTVGFPVNVTEFYSLAPLDVFKSPRVDVKKWIEPLLGVFPNEVKELLEHAQQGTYSSSNAEQLPAYFPQSKLQWSQALERLPSTDPNDLPSLFNFISAANIQKRAVLNVDGSILGHLTETLQTDIANDALNSLITITSSLKDNNEHILPEEARKILNIIIYNLRLDLLKEWIHGATVLLAEIANGSSQEGLTDYIIAVLEAFQVHVVQQECQSRLEELLDWVFQRIMSFSDPHPKMLQLFLNAEFNHCMELRDDLPWVKRLGYLEAIISNWPRTAWTVLHEVLIVRHCAQNSYTSIRVNQINMVLLWQVLTKYYGFKQLMPLLFQKPGLRHYYERASACLKTLDHIECAEIRDMAQVVVSKFVNYCHLYSIDKSAGDLCMYNQHIMDQSGIGELLKLTNPEVVLTDFAGNYFSVFF